MPVTALKRQKKGASKSKGIVVSKKVRDHSNDPFFVKKAKAAEGFLKKHGLPAAFTK